MQKIEYLPFDFDGPRFSDFRAWLGAHNFFVKFTPIWTPNFEPTLTICVSLIDCETNETAYVMSGSTEEEACALTMVTYRTPEELAAEAEAERLAKEKAEDDCLACPEEDQAKDDIGAVRKLLFTLFTRISNLETTASQLRQEVKECLKK